MNGVELYDVLDLPLPENQPRTVTIALQRVAGEGGSDYRSRVISVAVV